MKDKVRSVVVGVHSDNVLLSMCIRIPERQHCKVARGMDYCSVKTCIVCCMSRDIIASKCYLMAYSHHRIAEVKVKVGSVTGDL